MMEDFYFGVVVGFVIAVAFGILAFLVYDNLFRNNAYDRGYMVECLGKSGYYWDCGQ